jgi:alkane 1-monooxygenase
MRGWWTYTAVYIFGLLALFSFRTEGLGAWSVLLFAFVLVPLLDILFGPSENHISREQRKNLEQSRIYDWLLYLVVPLQYFCLFDFLNHGIHSDGPVLFGRLIGMGILCGVLGINVAHELGHRHSVAEQWMAKLLLITSGYGHFFIEHNRGHHRKVGTHDDPATARKGESLYGFWWRSVIHSYLSAWRIENNSRQNKRLRVWHWQNEMIQIHAMQLALWMAIMALFGWKALLLAIMAGVIGFLLLESIDYIEHYGLQRKEIKPGIYERVNEMHSWNCDFLPGRLLLFELSLHSDHHINSSIKYQALNSHRNSPQLPTGYPGSVIMALLPPLWFYVMNKRLTHCDSMKQDLSST